MKTWLTFFSLLVISISFGQERTVVPLDIGSKAPDFSLPGTDGKTYSLEDFSDYPFLTVVFTCNHCPTAQAYEDRLIRMVDEYRPKGIGFVAISPNDPTAISLSELGYSDMNDALEEMIIRVTDKGYNFPYLYDGDNQEASMAYGPAATPHVFIFDKDRLLRYRGRIDDTENPYQKVHTPDMRNALDALLSGTDIPVTETKTFGCSVKWSWKNDWIEREREQWRNEDVSLQEFNLDDIADLINNQSDKLRLINIWATWCGPCIIEFPDFVDIHRMYRNRKFEFISISTDKMGQKEKVHEFLTRFEASNTNYIFKGDDVYPLIEVVDPDWQGALPYTLLVEPGGKIICKTQGTISPMELKKTIVESLGRFYADD
ncbi:MAG TPA: redoxin domain-containing protein [Membranihabitans sp.]|nr:redoxin domain-containing protein [Membranihabitans sp.]